jgi:hypothetical protein
MLKTELGRNMDNASLFLHVNYYGVLLLLPAVLFFEGPILVSLFRAGGKPARLFCLNGLLYYINNPMNFLVLEKARPPRPSPLPRPTARHPPCSSSADRSTP